METVQDVQFLAGSIENRGYIWPLQPFEDARPPLSPKSSIGPLLDTAQRESVVAARFFHAESVSGV